MATLNVKTDYGAAGDGSTDDTVAIQEAVDDAAPGDTVYLPAGTYVVNKDNSVDNQACIMVKPTRGNGCDNVTFRGDGKDTTVMCGGGNDNFIQVIAVYTSETVTGLVFEDFVIDGNASNQASGARGQNIVAADDPAQDNDITIRNILSVDALDTGIAPRAGGVTVTDCTVRRAGKHGIGINPVDSECTVKRCLVTESPPPGSGEPTYALDFSDGYGLVEDCVFLNGSGTGFKVTEDPTDVTFRRIRSENNANHGFQRAGENSGNTTATFEDVVCRYNGDVGFRFAPYVTYKVPSGNAIVSAHNNGNNGYLLRGGTIEADGEVHSTGHPNLSFGTDTTGYIQDLYSTEDSDFGSVDVQNFHSSGVAQDLSNVPTKDEVGAWTSTDGGGGGGSVSPNRIVVALGIALGIAAAESALSD